MAASALKMKNSKDETIESWYIDESMEDHTLPNHLEPKVYLSSDQLKELGVLCWQMKVDVDNVNEDLKIFCEAKGYSQQFVIEVSPEKLPNYELNIKKFYEEHLHDEEEIHYIVKGSGYFDVRDKSDSWIRISAKKGCIIALPARIYHRFSLDSANYMKAIRLFSTGSPLLTSYRRPKEDLPTRNALKL